MSSAEYLSSARLAGGSQLPVQPGIGLKTQHLEVLLEQKPEIGFVEVHAENYMVRGGARLALLDKVRENYPLSIHGVGASIGGADPLDSLHLKRLKALLARFQPQAFSEHLAWSTHQGKFLNDLLPITYTQRSLDRVVEHIDQLQHFLGCQMLLENPSTYLQFSDSTIPETQFLTEIIKRTGCGLLLDVNNVFVTCSNHHLDPLEYLSNLPLAAAGEIHLAGYAIDQLASGEALVIDSHDAEVSEFVWQLYGQVINQTGALPTLLERDANLPELTTLVAEARLALPYLTRQDAGVEVAYAR